MIKTLRITSIIAAILAVVFVVLPAVFGVRSDEQTEQFLNSAGVVEKFNKAKGEKSAKSESQISPLVKQAEAFALYLNPPKPKTEKKTPAISETSFIPRHKRKVSAKFTLKGTSYYALHPELSLALIDEPGKGLHWVRQSSEVGYLVIEQVKDGLVVVRDGKRTFELVVERPEKRSLLKGASPDEAGSKSTSTALGKAGAGITGSRAPRVITEEDVASVEKFISGVKAMQTGIKSDKTDSEHRDEDKAAFEKLIEAMRISAGEAKRLDDLGKELDDIGADPNRKDHRAKIEARQREPNSPPDEK